MKKYSKILASLAIIMSLLSSQLSFITASEASPWAQSEIEKATQLELIPADLQADYQAPITRAEFTQLAVALLEKELGYTQAQLIDTFKIDLSQSVFDDTTSPTVLIAYRLEIIHGKGDRTFDPDASITRQEAAVILNNLMAISTALAEDKQPTNLPKDDSQIAAWSKTAVYNMLTHSILRGYPDHRFGPTDTYTRQQAYVTFLRLYDRLGFDQKTLSDKVAAIKKAPYVEKGDNKENNNNWEQKDITQALSEKDAFRQRILELVNIERKKAGVAALTMNTELTDYADLRATEITTSFSHTRPDGTSALSGVTNYRAVGENIATGYASAEATMEAWMNSDGHRQNILSPDFTQLSVGLQTLSSGGYMLGYSVVQIFYTPLN